MPLYNTQIEFVLQTAQAIAIGIDNGNIVILTDRGFPPACRRLALHPE